MARVEDTTAVVVEVGGEVVARLPPGGGTISAKLSLPAVGRRTFEVVARDAGGRTSRVVRAVTRVAAQAPDGR